MISEKDIGYTKNIIEEYHTLLSTWGHSSQWTLKQFRTLENMISEETKTDINANTLKRFFQQKTENPQLATKDALCRFLGYAGYTDYILKKTKLQEQERVRERVIDTETKMSTELPHETVKQATREVVSEYKAPVNKYKPYYWAGGIILICVCAYLLVHPRELYLNYLLSGIEFSASTTKGANPLNVTFTYKIPESLQSDISFFFAESDGDMEERTLNPDLGRINISYLYEGTGMGILKYKDKIIRSIPVEIRKPGWSVFVHADRDRFFRTLPIEKALSGKGYANIPIEDIPQEARQDERLFVSYVYYKENLADGDNFILEAKVRNSVKDNAIPCSDIMMYAFSDVHQHGFAINENCYAYIKFFSGENSIMGNEYNLSQYKFDLSEWHIMRIKVENKNTSFYVNDEVIQQMTYHNPVGMINELAIRFKGCGALEYVKVYNLDQKLLLEQSFVQKAFNRF